MDFSSSVSMAAAVLKQTPQHVRDHPVAPVSLLFQQQSSVHCFYGRLIGRSHSNMGFNLKHQHALLRLNESTL